MKIKRNRSKTPVKLIVIVAACVIVLAGGYATLALNQSWWPFMSQNNNAAETPATDTPSNPTAGNDTSVDEDSNIIQDGEGTKEETVKEDQSKNTGTADFTLTLNVTNPSANQVRIGTFIYRDPVTSSGTCSLTLTKGSSTISRSVGIQPVSKYSTCKFDPINNVASGTWKVNVKVTIDGKSATASKEVTVQ
jgi:hypothetical protein